MEKMIIVKVCEGLGNQLFQYAFARSLQIKSDKKVLLDTSNYTDERFPLARTDVKRSYQLDHFKIRIEKVGKRDLQKYHFLIRKDKLGKWISVLAEHHLWMYQVVIQDVPWEYRADYLHGVKNVYYRGWFQNPRYFTSIRKQLLKEIVPKHKIKIAPELRNLLRADNVVAVHYRRGDYKSINNCLPNDYYTRAMNYVEQIVENPQYLFFSDEILWVKEQMGSKKNFHYVNDYGKFEDYEELMIMSRCRNLIIANSTFSWWAAWLNTYDNKLVIMPQKWVHTKRWRDGSLEFPKDWIKL